MLKNFTPINIETTILAAIWKRPFIFQGYFTITSEQGAYNRVLIFYCKCMKKDKYDVLYQDFSPEEYQFNYIYNEQCTNIENLHKHATAIYLLKYSLNATLQKMVAKPDFYVIADEIALESLQKRAI